MKNKIICLIVLWIGLNLSACTSTPRKPYDYRSYLKHMPTSILVLPPVNQSLEVMAPYMYLSIVTRPLAEKGYYVYPVAVIDALMKENGVTSPAEMHQIPLNKIKEIIDPDAILYMTIKKWGTKYMVIDSQTTIHISARLIDTNSGKTLWQSEKQLIKSANDNANNIAEMLISALINQVLSNFFDPSIDVARKLNQVMYYNGFNGLLIGEHHPLFKESQKKCSEQMKGAYQ
ncbi:MAG: DUF799 family lipoprotein [Candidatus Magnetomorum sp.]|nr:DUF799 family lipoprotein [Candidatus Magnetomorum sp.]